MKLIMQQMLKLMAELVVQQKLQLVPISNTNRPDRWLDQRTTMHMLMRSDRQLLRYVREGLLISRKIGRSPWYLESSILVFIERSGEI